MARGWKLTLHKRIHCHKQDFGDEINHNQGRYLHVAFLHEINLETSMNTRKISWRLKRTNVPKSYLTHGQTKEQQKANIHGLFTWACASLTQEPLLP
jgi:hypothetical protein